MGEEKFPIINRLKANIHEYAKGKTWYWYVPVWLFGFYIFVKLLGFELGGEHTPFILAIPQAFDFMLHEFAHMMFAFAPDVITAAAGSMSELLLGLVLIWGAFYGKTYFASLFSFLWFMLACQATADYMSDARTQFLPLVNFDASGAQPIHDWNFVFTKLGLLESDTFIGGFVGLIGMLAGLFGLGFAAWLIYKMSVAEHHKELTHEEAQFLHNSAERGGIHAAPTEHFEHLKEGELYPKATHGRLSEEPDEVEEHDSKK